VRKLSLDFGPLTLFHTAAKKNEGWLSPALPSVHLFILVQWVQAIAKSCHCCRKVENS